MSFLPVTRPSTRNGPNRRAFCSGAAALLLARASGLRAAPRSPGPVQPSPPATPTRPDVAAIDRDRILAAAALYLALPPTTLTSLPCPRSPGTPHDYFSEAVPDADSTPSAKSTPPPFTAHRDALFTLGLAVPALAAAYLLTGEERYAGQAATHLRVWFVDAPTRMAPSLNYGQFATNLEGPPSGNFQGILETLPLVEIAQAIPFLSSSSALSDTDTKALLAWFAEYLHWLTQPQDSGPRLPELARDRKDHHGTSWLLQASAYATLIAPADNGPRQEDAALADLRHRYKTITLRAQISTEGTFPHDLASATPYRDSLFNLDMLAAVCHLLSTRFESIWDYELEDGPGMRSALAYHAPFIADRAAWPFSADVIHFDALPTRREGLLLAARAYQRPEYAALWKTLRPDPPQPDILRTIPIHQPLLWVRQPPLI